MISPHTAPGTLVVCINDAPYAFTPRSQCDGQMHGLHKGAVYTVSSIEPSFRWGIDLVIIKEISRTPITPGFHLGRFDLAVLPKCLADIPNTVRRTERVPG